MGNEVIVDLNGKGEDTYTVISGDEKTGFTFESEFGEREQDVESPMGAASTDFSELIGKKVRFVVSPTGIVSGLEGFDELPEIMSATQEKITKDAYIIGAKASFPLLPENPVKFGDTWTESDEQEVPMEGGTIKIVSNSTYTLIEEIIKDGLDCVKIEVSSTVKTTGNFEQQGMLLKIDRESKATETIHFAYKKGMYLSREGASTAEGIITVESMGMEMPQKITGKSNVTVKFIEEE